MYKAAILVKHRQSVFLLFVGFVCSVIVVFCCCLVLFYFYFIFFTPSYNTLVLQ